MFLVLNLYLSMFVDKESPRIPRRKPVVSESDEEEDESEDEEEDGDEEEESEGQRS